ncbi:MAG: response regulator [Ktedonobacteraceae bacterium]
MNQNNRPRKILVVDDDSIIREMMVDILSFEGYTVDTARNGLEALNILRKEDNYLVFLDIMMPVMDGKEVCIALEADPALRKRHVIVLMSAVSTLAEVTSLITYEETLPKPFFVEDVMRVVEPYMG